MNNGGWGLRMMLFFCMVFMFFIIYVAVEINENFISLTSRNDRVEVLNFSDLEVKMVNAAKKYINQKYPDIQNDIEFPIKMSTLINNNYIAPIKDIYTKNTCNGYVMFIKNDNNIEYQPYLKCESYKTNQYNDQLD